MGGLFRWRNGLVAVLAIAVGGLFALAALAATPLSGSKTATAHWTRTFEWSIETQLASCKPATRRFQQRETPPQPFIVC